MSDRRLALGLDIGGSSVKSALIATTGGAPPEIIEKGLRPVDGRRRPGDVVEDLALIFDSMASAHGTIATVGVGLPGMFDPASGAPTLLPNFPPEWVGFPIRQVLQERLRQPIVLVNDAKAFTVAESFFGAGAGHKCVVAFVLGTGVGGGVVIDGELWRGLGSAGELGHLTVDVNGPACGCGSYGCVEAFAGSRAIIARGGRETVHQVFEAAAAGDPQASVAVEEAINALGAGLASVFITLAPDVFVVGGGIADAGAQLFEPLVAEVRRRVQVAPEADITVVRARLGRHAGALGAALMAATTRQAIPAKPQG